ncbi:MAG: DUF503 domain-containing protein [Spirochaetae bacterium HGW-Spirochaetae-7]|jgi:hypothetical protein|nr:MAG: DUF503 domain-containing protein [Spirochaetae bacterium HGW-Spirochaetae-7]
MLQVIFEVPESSSLKDKRRVVKSIKDKLRLRFHVSCAETDLQDSLRFAELGAAIVSNSTEFGETVMRKALAVIEGEFSLRIHDSSIASERFD